MDASMPTRSTSACTDQASSSAGDGEWVVSGYVWGKLTTSQLTSSHCGNWTREGEEANKIVAQFLLACLPFLRGIGSKLPWHTYKIPRPSPLQFHVPSWRQLGHVVDILFRLVCLPRFPTTTMPYPRHPRPTHPPLRCADAPGKRVCAWRRGKRTASPTQARVGRPLAPNSLLHTVGRPPGLARLACWSDHLVATVVSAHRTCRIAASCIRWVRWWVGELKLVG
ncbi:uncharacterized protein J3D65DRAFT_627463 [Phyllosticta citribraziliensis]|uniref:Uncharacterized protein n=1 Tax=Phyllosticta citribraziliensis TaxID=989973 RepID=A0ABR1LQ29_9PEZI